MKVLIADDEMVSRRLLESSARRWGYEPIVAQDGDEALQVLMSPDAPKLAVLDWQMPGLSGPQLCRSVRSNKPVPYTYLILLTGKAGKEDVIEGLEAGADDYVTKPFDPAELKVRLRTGKRILYLQEQLISAREALRDQATRDPLTGLWNRAELQNILNGELTRAQRAGASVAVVLCDLDYFKRVNDTYGHPVGDEVLRGLAQTMRDVTRRYDCTGRYGGEEFLIVLPGCNESNAVSHAERLRAAVEKMSVDTPAGEIRCTISLGVAIADPTTTFDAAKLIQAADVALYRAKDNGRNRVELGKMFVSC